jgi:hypothetical protein
MNTDTAVSGETARHRLDEGQNRQERPVQCGVAIGQWPRLQHISNCPQQQRHTVVVVAEPDVALAAEQAADHVGLVAVIDGEPVFAGLPADRAHRVLLPEQLFIIFRRHSIFSFQLALMEITVVSCQLVGAIFGIGCIPVPLPRVDFVFLVGVAVAPACVDLRFVGGVAGSFRGKHSCPVVRILGVAFLASF